LDWNPAPFTVSVNPKLPGVIAIGTNGWLMKGTGFDCPNRAIVERIAKVNGSVLFMFSSKPPSGRNAR
jgi:hypothetical protein